MPNPCGAGNGTGHVSLDVNILGIEHTKHEKNGHGVWPAASVRLCAAARCDQRHRFTLIGSGGLLL
jgi:hypothetical protein